jgi:dTDP-4-amino-4,6-dideoxygalactose transaminase
MGGAELGYIYEAFNTNWVAPLGPNVDGFEKDIEAYTGAKHAAALSSGTAAIHLALILSQVGYGDEVICQSFTFSASANPIVYQGAMPVFIDSENETWNMSPEFLQEAIKDRLKRGKKPKAIIPVHLYGMPAKMNAILELADEYEIPVIEDAAEALGSCIGGKKCGTFGKCGILSFNGNKIITTSGGGALISDDEGLIAKARFLATQARDPAPHYQHSHIGYNYRMSNIVAGIGRGQMQVLGKRIEARRANFEKYKNYFEQINLRGYKVYLLPEPEGCYSNRWLTTIIIDPSENGGTTREDIRLALQKENIESRPLWKPMHLQPVFSGAPYYGSDVSERLFEQGLCLPSGSNLSDEEWERIFSALQFVFRS